MTSSLAAVPHARQRQAPRVCHRPPFVSEAAAEEAIEFAESLGLFLQPWQQTVVRAILAEQEDGRYAASSVGYLVARQNGKSWILDVIALHGMFLVEDPLTVWTSHEMKTSAESFLRMRGWIEGSEDLSKLLLPAGRSFQTGNGREGITLANGVRLKFYARSKNSGRGPSPQRIIFDEAQELSDLALEALAPSMSAQPNRQAIYCGTVPGPQTNNPEVFTRIRDRGRAASPGRHAWLEWTPVGSDDPKRAMTIDLDDPRTWTASNPARATGVMSDDSIRDDRQDMSDEGFARERCSIWPTIADGGTGVIDAAHFAGCRAEPDDLRAPLTLAVETSFDRSVSTVAIVGARVSDGLPQVEIVDERAGTAWVGARVVELCQRHAVDVIVVDGKSPAAPLVTDIELALEAAGLGVELRVTDTADLAEGCAQLFDSINQETVRHTGDPWLNEAVRDALQRTVGDGAWVWARRLGGPRIIRLTAWTLALWAWRDLNEADYDPLDSIG